MEDIKISGQCECKADRSGRKCDQCKKFYYGDPRKPDGCMPCDCDSYGSLGALCDPITGQCPCSRSVAGRRCDKCDRGTRGRLPHCEPCGQCWTDWDTALNKVSGEAWLLDEASL
ncbi:unnamed protein product [Protopolystoma xenopodis]|uniref:Laminin EGF-like domain-containing protein n=1 Tax=Protopolystoma xenopodis TaxID=117903 RepID=A0A3S5A4T6_9PLAT|nr:unnamed protein product [Protopolystoma xenopodis]